jgi:Flp pilus assembly protein TadG
MRGEMTTRRAGSLRRRRASGARETRGARGQALAEFALVLIPLLGLFLGIIQLGFIFNAYVTVSNAAREGARAGSIWIADPSASVTSNDGGRNSYINSVIDDSLGLLSPSDATTNISYVSSGSACTPAATADSRRKDQCVSVHVDYALTLIIPFVANILGSGGTMTIGAESQMVIN